MGRCHVKEEELWFSWKVNEKVGDVTGCVFGFFFFYPTLDKSLITLCTNLLNSVQLLLVSCSHQRTAVFCDCPRQLKLCSHPCAPSHWGAARSGLLSQEGEAKVGPISSASNRDGHNLESRYKATPQWWWKSKAKLGTHPAGSTSRNSMARHELKPSTPSVHSLGNTHRSVTLLLLIFIN